MIKPVINQFNGGEISPELEGRFDWDKYNYSAKLCKNFIPLVEGCLKRRGGTHFVNKTEETPLFKVKFVFKFNDTTDVLPVRARLDDTDFDVTEASYETNVELGETLNYSFYANNYVEVNGSVEVFEDKVIEVNFINVNDAVTLNIITDPVDAECLMNGVATRSLVVEYGAYVTVEATYRGETRKITYVVTENTTKTIIVQYVAFVSWKFEATEVIKLNRGKYYVTAVGGSGGAGGGTYGDNHKSTGAGGGSGAFYQGDVLLEGEYTVSVGRWGAGGYNGNDKWDAGDGHDGTATYISNVFSCGGGTGGARGGGKGDPDYYGKGGSFIAYNPDVLLSEGVNGNGAIRYTGGISPYKEKFNGGSGVYKKNGKTGYGGYLKIVYNGEWK